MDEGLSLAVDQLAEGLTLECKKAGGRDGRGELPQNFWETYSAMANTAGGVVLLGVEEKPPRVFSVYGIKELDRVQSDLWSGVHNRDFISHNLLVDASVAIETIGEKSILRIRIPRADRHSRPVHRGSNPIGNTFRRNHSGNYRCDDDTVKRMLADQLIDERDAVLQPGSTLDDIDLDSLEAFRRQMRVTRPRHHWLDEPDIQFLDHLGAWTTDRETGAQGLTLAGLLMFGKHRPIHHFVPKYLVDYKELVSEDDPGSWVERVTTDGTWSGNLFDFYRRTIQRLGDGLKIPWRIEGTTRIDDTAAHVALREALVNTLIHADYMGSLAILVTRYPGGYRFQNPGMMRLPLDVVLQGGRSDCRNRNLQKMFQLAGLGEQSGAGVGRIFRSWRQHDWRDPELDEDPVLDVTTLDLRTVSLFPPEVVESLSERFGEAFAALTDVQRLALATVEIEGHVTHSRLRSMTTDHAADISGALAALVRSGYLESTGLARGTAYRFPVGTRGPVQPHVQSPRAPIEQAELELFADLPKAVVSEAHTDSQHGRTYSQHGGVDSQHAARDSQHVTPDSQHDGGPSDDPTLIAIAMPVRGSTSAPEGVVDETIIRLCAGRYLTTQELASLLAREVGTLRNHYLGRLLSNKRLFLQDPENPTSRQRAYTSTRPANTHGRKT